MKKSEKILYFSLFAIYLGFLIWVVLFKTEFSFQILTGERVPNFIPFNYGDAPSFVILKDAVLNVLVFLPLGLYLKMFGWKLPFAIGCGAGLSLCFEMIQFAFSIGAADITDLITNTAGTAFGALLGLLLLKAVKNRNRLDRIMRAVCCSATAAALLLFFTLLIRYLM